jgi:hypothetical protein
MVIHYINIAYWFVKTLQPLLKFHLTLFIVLPYSFRQIYNNKVNADS